VNAVIYQGNPILTGGLFKIFQLQKKEKSDRNHFRKNKPNGRNFLRMDKTDF